MDSSKSSTSCFNVFITGQIESVSFPLGPDADDIFLRYEVSAGPDWELCSGLQTGITQTATNRNGNFNDKIVFNMPIELTYKSTSPFGWPQIIMSVYGRNFWGTETLLGYGRIHMPIFGAEKATLSGIRVPILVPKCTNMISDLTTWITRRNPELKNPKILLDATKCKGLSMEAYGTVELQLKTVIRGASKLGYEWRT